MKKLTNDQTKIDLVSKLVRDGAIDFAEAITLIEEEVEKEYVYLPNTITIPPPSFPPIPQYPSPVSPFIPVYPQYPSPCPPFNPSFKEPYRITCGNSGCSGTLLENPDLAVTDTYILKNDAFISFTSNNHSAHLN